MHIEILCPHCSFEVSYNADHPEVARMQRVCHLIGHALQSAVGVNIDVFGDIDALDFCDEADTWPEAATCARELILAEYGDRIDYFADMFERNALDEALDESRQRLSRAEPPTPLKPSAGMLDWLARSYRHLSAAGIYQDTVDALVKSAEIRFGRREIADRWMRAPNGCLEGATPMDVLREEAGYSEVLQALSMARAAG